jgi:hypothetical protein
MKSCGLVGEKPDVPPKRRYLSTRLHCVIMQEISTRIVAAVKISTCGPIYTKVFILQTVGDLKPLLTSFEIRTNSLRIYRITNVLTFNSLRFEYLKHQFISLR